MRAAVLCKGALAISGLAIVVMAGTAVACTPRTEKPSEMNPENVVPSEKDVRINVTRDPASYAPDRNNPAVPCGYQQAGTWCW